MTIKPITAPTQKRVGVGGGNSGGSVGETDKKDCHQNSVGNVVVESVSNVHQHQQTTRNVSSSHNHRNIVLDGPAQSPQRRVGINVGDVYDDLTRHRCSPHKISRPKRRDNSDHNHHHKRDHRQHGDKLATATGVACNVKCNAPHSVSGSIGGITVVPNCNTNALTSASKTGGSNNPPEHLLLNAQNSQTSPSAVTPATGNMLNVAEETYSGYNSGDEHLPAKEASITVDEWQKRDEQFSKCMTERGYVLKPVEEDGACLFRSISLQIYGDEEMHDVIRQHTMDYIYKNKEYFSQFVTEDINNYINRKRRKDSHGNHIEIQAISEIYNRPIEVYCYKPTPINIFNSEQLNNGYAPLRLSYQRGSHYNAIIDPYNATVGVGLGLAGYKPELQTEKAKRLSEQLEIEQTMFEDKLKTTDWEATNEAIEEEIARESYLQWCRENLQKSRNVTATQASTSATVTSGEVDVFEPGSPSPSKYITNALGVGVGSTKAATCATNAPTNNNSSLNNTYINLSPKYLNNFSQTKKDDLSGFDSDDTDMSSTSSLNSSSNGNNGNSSPSQITASRGKKSKSRNSSLNGSVGSGGSGALKTSKKRRREKISKREDEKATNQNNIKFEIVANAAREKRSKTPDFEQQKPSTSKQSNTPEKQSSLSTAPNETNSKPISTFYQELLEATYASDGYGQLSESEMLQRAIQMSTQDYIENQKRKYFYGP